MVNIKSAEFLVGIITFFIVYLVSITLANFFQAWLARLMGDDTAEQFGFLTLNPLVHIDPIGLGVLFLFYSRGNYFGWGRHVPISSFTICGPLRTLKIIVVALGNSIAHFVLAFIGIVVLEIMFDASILPLVRHMVLTANMSHLFLAHHYPSYGSLTIAVGFIITAMVYFNIMLGVFYSIINSRDIFIVLTSDSPLAYEERRSQLSNVVIPILLVIFLSSPLRYLAVKIMVYGGHLIVSLMKIF